MRKLRNYLDEGNLVVRQGHQLWHLHQALKQHEEADVIGRMAADYQASGRVKTIGEGMVLAGAIVTAYRSTEAGERVPQRARAHLDQEAAERKAAQAQLKPKEEAGA